MVSASNLLQGTSAERKIEQLALANECKTIWLNMGWVTGRESDNDILYNKKFTHSLRDDIARRFLCRYTNNGRNMYANDFNCSDNYLFHVLRLSKNANQIFINERWIDTIALTKAGNNIYAKIMYIVKCVIKLMGFKPSLSPSPSAFAYASASNKENDELKTELNAVRRHLDSVILEQRLLRSQLLANPAIQEQLDQVTMEKEALEDRLDQIRYNWTQAKACMQQ